MADPSPPLLDDQLDDGKLLTPAEVAKLARLDRQTVYRYIKAGKLSAVHLTGRGPGRPIRIPARAVRDLLADRD